MSRPYSRIIVLDAETAWGRAVKLGFSCQTNEEYLRDPRFKAWGLCWKDFGDHLPATWIRGKDIQAWADTIDWSTTAVIAQNAQFDASILAWHYNARPAFIFDTLSMGRALRSVERGNSLAKMAEDFGLPDKGAGLAPSENILDELPFHVEQTLADYCRHDVFLCEAIFKILSGAETSPNGVSFGKYPAAELRLIDMTLQMYINPRLELDQNMLFDAIEEERTTREALLARLNIDDKILASNPKFAELLSSMGCAVPYKKSKTTGKPALALAKNDALFQALLNGDNDDVRLLCEARLRVKSTTERTRAQRFLDISSRGALPVPLAYYGAGTGRWTASKGSAINMQNLKRGSFLRKAIMAPEGSTLVVGDLSQIEPRVLAWLSDYDDLLNIFRSGQDAYAMFGAQMFNVPGMTKESHGDLRQSAKSALLGCFGGDTLVLTNRGWLPIVQVQVTDMVWDGEEWVWHQGVVSQGEKEVLTSMGLSATRDHEILTEHGWVEWSEALADLCLLQSALSLGNSLALAGSAALMAPNGKVDLLINPACGVRVDGKAFLKGLTCVQDEQPVVTLAQKRKHTLRAWLNKGLNPCAQTLRTGSAFLRGLAPSSVGVQTQAMQHTQTTVGGASRYTLSGLTTALCFCSTLLDWMAGTLQSINSTALTTTKGISQKTYASLQEAQTCRTNARSKYVMSKPSSEDYMSLKQKMQTYDIAYAGPRNSYTVLTSEGPLIVHNCGYGLGWASFASQLLTGFLGAPPVRYDMAFAKKLGVNAAYVEKFLSWEDNVTKLEAIPHTCTMKELLVHAVAAKKIIDIYRATAHPVVSFWEMCGNLLETALYGGQEFRYKCLVFRKGEIEMPNGMKLLYPDLRREKDDKGRSQYVYGPDATKLYPGKITNNVTQGVARIVMTDGMLRTTKRYPVVGTVHDEQIVLVPETESAEALEWVLAQMTMEPKYMPGIPLDAEGGTHKRYGLAKK